MSDTTGQPGNQEHEQQQVYAQGYHVGYQHGLQAAREAADQANRLGPAGYHSFNLTAQYPPSQSRLLMFFWFVRGLLLFPHGFILAFLGMAAFWVGVFSWFAVVFTGSYPRPLWDFQVGVMRWSVRCQAYVLGLTDDYPPFTLN
ncbi:MAG TPA: DUF4389 domain-containing protein [Symbiobacteriaceae bacterium]|nr:DUF4389 domain-containing protein [Symbiobacteriaceae bacterium]